MFKQFAHLLLLCLICAVPAQARAATQSDFDDQIAVTKSHIMSDPAKALTQARKASTIAGKLPASQRQIAEATSQWLQGEALTRLNRADQAAPIIASALGTVRKVAPRSKLHADLLKSSAAISTENGKIEQSLALLHQAHGIYETLGDKRGQAIVLNLIGSIYQEARDYNRVLKYYNESQQAYPEDIALTLSTLNNRGNAYSNMGKDAEAEEQYRLALKAAKEMDSPILEARILTNLATAQLKQGQNAKADQTALNGLRIANGEAGEWQPYLWGVRAQIALADGKPAVARTYIERTFKGIDLENSATSFRDYHATAAEIYEKLGVYDLALRHLTAFKRLDDNGRDLAASTNAALVSAEFDNTNRELKISKLEAQEIQRELELNNSERALNYSIIALVCAFLIIGMLFYSISNARRTRKEISKANAKLYHSSTHDLLTGLPNRAHFGALLTDALIDAHESHSRCAVMIVDLDRFKAVNDTLGHSIGDQLLREVAIQLKSVMGDYAQPVRLGGDEFAIVVPDIANEERLNAAAKSVIEALSTPFKIDGATVSIGATIGMATGPDDSDQIEQLTRCADLALYDGKKSGRGRYVRYRKQMQIEADERHDLERDLHEALNNGDLSIAYQSIVEAETNRIICYEALLRWQHPTRGTISPDVFIPIAEDARLINNIGSWVLRSACEEAATWPDDIKVAVNVSALQVEGGSLPANVVSALAASGLAPERLELEVTESVFLNNRGKSEEALDGLRALGINLVLDDFGTGFSSLGYLRRASFSTIKIDRSFVKSATNGSNDSVAIIRAIVTLAEELGMNTTAEGIEDEQQLAVVRELGCSQLQGYFFSRPEAGVQSGAAVVEASGEVVSLTAKAPLRKAG